MPPDTPLSAACRAIAFPEKILPEIMKSPLLRPVHRACAEDENTGSSIATQNARNVNKVTNLSKKMPFDVKHANKFSKKRVKSTSRRWTERMFLEPRV
jgi:hypothetical protein